MVGTTDGDHGAAPAGAAVDRAVARARRVVGLYGDPDVTFSIVVALRLRAPRAREAVIEAARALVRDHPHLGLLPEVVTYAVDAEQPVLDAFANTPYGEHDPLVRVALSQDGRDLVLAAHHGAIDGLGMLGAASTLIGAALPSSARGIQRSAEPSGFVRGSARRLAEAMLRPPARLDGDRRGPSTRESAGDWLEARTVLAPRPSSAALVCAAVDLVRARNRGRDLGARRLVVGMGLSRRPGTPVQEPDRDTAYIRLAADRVRSTEDARALFARTPPEPAFPVTDAHGLAPRVARWLSHRLGATVLVSNLGLVDSQVVESIRFWPVPTGPAGVCLGLASTPTATVLTVRARRRWFSGTATGDLADLAAECLERVAQ